ncbi:MAG: peptidylprolyl isomerase [Planctomycetes bacterium]|nr:peptidylprolyl isomerase [Planctomycetota bacterium]
MSNTIADGKVVSIHYKLTLDNGTVVDSSEGQDPLDYLHGAQNIVPGLEKQLTGKTIGDAVQAKVAPSEGYGERDEQAIQEVERGAFPADADVSPGITFQALDEDQNPLLGTIVKVDGNSVTVDFNHPLAGHNLNFEVTIEAIRDATSQEQEHGHAHGAHGHDH